MAKYWFANNPNAECTNAEATALGALSQTEIEIIDGCTATTAELNKAADASVIAPVALTATAAIDSTARCIKLAHNSTPVLITGPSGVALAGQTMFITNTSGSGTAAHAVTLAAGTFDGTNNTATLNAPAESLIVMFDSAGVGCVVVNTGSVALSDV